ncbi:CoA-binding protein [Actinomycetospora lutea]|uniref:CoA-binding protein n=1 Tax=Actinomycetospora lutea TaxID=663604 RepID=UPI0023660ACA|nr:CoA-binding protein [Actinomycetospora lutea]MDD7937075.1 CoA-binding protein [Actinomycetospora lutea]
METGLVDDAAVGALLTGVRRVAVLGVSDRFNRPSFRLAAYLLDRTGWSVDLVNPHVVETLGRLCAPLLADVPTPDLVVVFRAPGAWDAVVDEVAAVGGGAVWLPAGVADADTTARVVARAHGLGVRAVADRDLRAEHKRWCP